MLGDEICQRPVLMVKADKSLAKTEYFLVISARQVKSYLIEILGIAYRNVLSFRRTLA